MPRRESSRKTLQGFILKHILALANDCHLPGVISVSYSVHFIVPCCTQRSVRCSTEDGFSPSLAKCLSASQLHLRVILGPSSSFSFETAWNSSARFLHLAEVPRLPLSPLPLAFLPRAGARCARCGH